MQNLYGMYIILGIVCIILSEVCKIGIIIWYIVTDKRKKENNVKAASIVDSTERLKLYINHDFDKIDSRIDMYIQDAGTKYKIEHFEYKDPDKIYLNSEEMQNMITTMTKTVMDRITPAVFTLIQLSYNVNNKDELIAFLCEKIKIYVLSYSLEVNGDIE